MPYAFNKTGFLILAAVLSLVPVLHAQAKQLRVPDDHATIQAAIDAAQAGDVIIVEPGTYTENLRLRNELEIKGEETARTFLQPANNQALIDINDLNNCTFKNFTLINNNNTSTTGIRISNSTHIEIHNMVFNLGNNAIAVSIADQASVDIINNTFFNNGTGIAGSSNLTTIQNNIFSGNTNTVTPANNQDNISFNCFATDDTPAGSDTTRGAVRFVDSARRDLHLRADSVCIDAGTGLDALDNTTADAGAYGGEFADSRPFPLAQITLTDTSPDNPPPYHIRISWPENTDYRVAGYRIYYDHDQPGAPYEGESAYNASDLLTPSPINVGKVTQYTLHNVSVTGSAPEAPELLEIAPGNQSLTLEWSAASNANAYRIEYGLSSLDEHHMDTGNVTRHTLRGLQNNAAYRVTVRALRAAKYYVTVSVLDNGSQANESALATEQNITLGAPLQSARSNERSGIPETVQAYPALPDQGDSRCFIASAAYGHYSAPQVELLRTFRDRYLSNNRPGRALVQTYYRISPPLAEQVQQHAWLAATVRVLLVPAIALAWLCTQTSALLQGLMLAGLFILIVTLCYRKLVHIQNKAQPRL